MFSSYDIIIEFRSFYHPRTSFVHTYLLSGQGLTHLSVTCTGTVQWRDAAMQVLLLTPLLMHGKPLTQSTSLLLTSTVILSASLILHSTSKVVHEQGLHILHWALSAQHRHAVYVLVGALTNITKWYKYLNSKCMSISLQSCPLYL